VETSRPVVDAKRHHLHIGPMDPALVLDIDPARIAQILTNLLNNAANYTPPGGHIELAVVPGEREVRIAVRDNGIGIAPAQLREIFQLFVQAQPSPAGGGLGIGLSLSASLAELHGGRVEGHSEGPGRGSEFVLVLPRAGGSGAPVSAPTSPERAAS
jgi:signal transduction histidine kinase